MIYFALLIFEIILVSSYVSKIIDNYKDKNLISFIALYYVIFVTIILAGSLFFK